MSKIKVKSLIETEENEMNTKVVFLIDEKYKHRFLLTKHWDKNNDRIATVIMLNPSKADAVKIDLTVMNLMNYLYNNGFGGMTIVNLFSYMSTYPKNLKNRMQDFEDINFEYIEKAFTDATLIIIAWTRNEKMLQKRKIKNLLTEHIHKMKCFKDNNGIIMRHPSRGFNEKWTLVDYNFDIEGL